MASPFNIDEINPVVLQYYEQSGAPVFDPATGLSLPGDRTAKTILAYVKNARNDPAASGELAENPYSQRVKVYCITPMYLPGELGEGSTLDYLFTEPARVEFGADEKTVTGKLTITRYQPSQLPDVVRELGDVFTGYLLLD